MGDLNILFKKLEDHSFCFFFMVDAHVPCKYQNLYQRKNTEAACGIDLFDPFQYILLKLHIQFNVVPQEG